MDYKFDYEYLLDLLTKRKVWLVDEVRRSMLDKRSSLATMKLHEEELCVVDNQMKMVMKEIGL